MLEIIWLNFFRNARYRQFDPHRGTVSIKLVTQTRLACDSENKHGAGLEYGKLTT